MDAIWLALIAAIVTPLVTLYVTNTQRRSEKEEDWRRQDELADRQAKAAAALLKANQTVAATAELTNGKLDIIHALVNSQLTASMQAELDARTSELAMMNEVLILKERAGVSANGEGLAAIASIKRKIKKLDAALDARMKEDEALKEDVAEDRARSADPQAH